MLTGSVESGGMMCRAGYVQTDDPAAICQFRHLGIPVAVSTAYARAATAKTGCRHHVAA